LNGLFAAVRSACARVADRARFVSIDTAALERFFAAHSELAPPASADPAHQHFADPATTLAYVVTLDAINFGSGWFPELVKRPGMSGYFTVATCLREQFARAGAWSAADLAKLDAQRCAEVFGQHGNAAVRDLLELFARALRDLGDWLAARHGGSFERAVAAADGSAERLATSLCEMTLYRDVARHSGVEVPLYKRAQITAADLAAAFGGRGPGAFRDLRDLTIFADNLVPHVLRCEGVLVYDPDLVARIEREELLPAGSPEEVEIRAVALHAVELAVRALRERGVDASAHELDYWLWHRGQRPEIKAHPRHRTRCPYY
jgi:Potential Queuosine, Q, salvage protein family